MKIRYEHWQIAFRKKTEEKFKLIPNPSWGWAADPFLVRYKGELYLFAELYLYKSERNGVIGYCKFDGKKFGKWFVSMDKHWHISYPNVWVENEKLYMCPETCQADEVAIYELIDFPDKWKKICVLLDNGKYADSTFLFHDEKKYLFTYQHTASRIDGNLLLYVMDDDGHVGKPLFISDDISSARPGGKFIKRDKDLIRVSQDCSNGYGRGLVFCKVESVFPNYREKELKRIYPESINGQWKKTFTGIHTYNCYDDIEVIDLKYKPCSIKEYFARKRVRKVFTNKYR